MSRGIWFALLLIGLAIVGLSRGPSIAGPADSGALAMPGCDSPCGDCQGDCGTDIACQNQCGALSGMSLPQMTETRPVLGRTRLASAWFLPLLGLIGAPPTPPPKA
ncbi:MAG: hypothetical protein IT562_24335 [Alphaproteobacteria bacterium]|nr:hypothetical protein [Alphaproteobacteria bacterium]